MKPTQRQLEKALDYWTRLLRIQDWDIRLEFVRQRGLPAFSLGCNDLFPPKRQSHIKIMDPTDYANTHTPFPTEHDWELTLVHELLHIVLAPISRGEDDSDAEETVIHFLSTALLKQQRGTA